MSTLSLRLPASLHDRLRDLAKREGVSINQLVTLAAAEKVAALLTIDYLAERARGADLRAFDRLLSRVPSVPPQPGDELPARAGAASEVREPARRYSASGRRAKKR